MEICNVIKEKDHGESRYYIEIVMHYAGVSAALVNPDPVKKPRVRCRTSDLAVTVSQQINYAKRMYIEHLYTLSNDNILISEDWVLLLFWMFYLLFSLEQQKKVRRDRNIMIGAILLQIFDTVYIHTLFFRDFLLNELSLYFSERDTKLTNVC